MAGSLGGWIALVLICWFVLYFFRSFGLRKLYIVLRHYYGTSETEQHIWWRHQAQNTYIEYALNKQFRATKTLKPHVCFNYNHNRNHKFKPTKLTIIIISVWLYSPLSFNTNCLFSIEYQACKIPLPYSIQMKTF